jgi:hypothetical protein
MGRLVFEEKAIADNKKVIETSFLKNGIYFVRIYNGNDSRVEKLVINQ